MIVTTTEAPERRRVLLAVEPAGINPGSLRIAMQLSRSLRAELASLLLEDVALLRAAALPFAREIDRSGDERPLSLSTLERSLRVREARLRDELAHQIDPSGIAWSLRCLRGAGLAMLLGEIGRTDVMVLGRAPRSPWSGQARSPHAVVLYRHPQASRLGRAPGHGEHALLPGLAWEALPWTDAQRTLPLLLRRQPQLVLLAGPAQSWPGEDVRQLIERLDCPILLMPPQDA